MCNWMLHCTKKNTIDWLNGMFSFFSIKTNFNNDDDDDDDDKTPIMMMIVIIENCVQRQSAVLFVSVCMWTAATKQLFGFFFVCLFVYMYVFVFVSLLSFFYTHKLHLIWLDCVPCCQKKTSKRKKIECFDASLFDQRKKK